LEDHPGTDALVGETIFEELSETFCHTCYLRGQLVSPCWNCG
jgi:hypothetical protein